MKHRPNLYPALECEQLEFEAFDLRTAAAVVVGSMMGARLRLNPYNTELGAIAGRVLDGTGVSGPDAELLRAYVANLFRVCRGFTDRDRRFAQEPPIQYRGDAGLHLYGRSNQTPAELPDEPCVK